MFEMLRSLPALRAIAVAHQAIGVARHLKPLPVDERARVAQSRAAVAGDTETELALAVIEEMERAAGAPLSEIDDREVERYLGDLANSAMEQMRREFRPDAQRGRERLREMRRTVTI